MILVMKIFKFMKKNLKKVAENSDFASRNSYGFILHSGSFNMSTFGFSSPVICFACRAFTFMHRSSGQVILNFTLAFSRFFCPISFLSFLFWDSVPFRDFHILFLHYSGHNSKYKVYVKAKKEKSMVNN